MSLLNQILRLLGINRPTPAPVDPPVEQPAPTTREVRVTLWRDGKQFVPTGGAIDIDAPTADEAPLRVAATVTDERRLLFVVPAARFEWGANFVAWTSDYTALMQRIVLKADVDVELPASRPALPPIDLPSGRYLTAGGQRLHVFGITAFRLLEMMAHGREAEVESYLQLAGANRVVPRVFVMCANLFTLDPAEGVAFLRRFLELAQKHGVYVELVALVDTASFPAFDVNGAYAYVEQIGQIAKDFGNVLLELGNELSPLHQTQAEWLGQAGIHEKLESRVPASVPVSWGSTHADRDETLDLAGGDYLTAHMSRSDAENGWKWVRHTNELGAIADSVGRYAINDEPRRDDLTPGKHLALAFLCRVIRGIGHTFHYAGGLGGIVPRGDELRAWNAARDGFYGVAPWDWQGVYRNAGQGGSPVKSFSGALRAYSSVRGDDAYTLVLDVNDKTVIEWSSDWTRQTLVRELDGTRIYYVQR